MDDGAMVAQKWHEQVGAREENSGNRARITVVLSASNGVAQSPEVLSKATNPSELRDVDLFSAPRSASIRSAPSATHNTPAAVAIDQEEYSRVTTKQAIRRGANPSWRALLIDQFTAQVYPATITAMVHCKRAPIVVSGRLTPRVQVTHRLQNPLFKAIYTELETAQVAREMEQRRWRGIPRLTRAEILCLVAQTHNTLRSDKQYVGGARSQFSKAGATLALDGTEDHLPGRKLKGI